MPVPVLLEVLELTTAPPVEPQPLARVCVAIPTFRRPEQLAVLLRHLALQIIDSSEYDLRFVVIDNDLSPTAESIVENTRLYFANPIDYVHLPEPGLAAVRNAALEYASAEDRFLVMIDDDEVPAPGWLAELLRVWVLTEADAVIGPVPTYFPSGTPAWVKNGRFFELPRNKDGARLDYGITGNCLLNLSSIRAMGLHFDSAFGLSGGEDTMFFRQLRAKGGKIVYAAKAVATEYIPLSRTRLGYLVARKFGNGNSHALCDLELNRTLRSEGTVLMRGLLLIPWSLSMAPLRILLCGRAGAARSIFDMSRGLGKLAALFGFRFLGYSRANDAKWDRSASAIAETITSSRRFVVDLKPIKKLARRIVPYHLIRRYSLSRAVPEPELRGLSRMAGSGCFIDVGANYGEWSWSAARHFKHVHAFEPIGMLAALLKKTLPRNVDVHAIALSDRSGQAVLETPIVAGDHIHALASLEKHANGEVPTTASEVVLRTLDELEIRNVDAIKIDVEGHEESTLRGARATIERERPVLVVEIEERHHIGKSEDIIAGLVARDYSAFYFKDGLRPYEAGSIGELQAGPVFEADVKNPAYINNFIFIPNEKPELRAAFY